MIRLSLALLFCSMTLADTITLKNGQQLQGTFLGGDTRTVRFVIGSEVRTIAVPEIAIIRFGNASPIPATAPEARKPEGSGDQKQLCQAVLAFRQDNMSFSNEANPIRRAEMRRPDPFDYEPRVVAILGESGAFMNWTGTVRFSVEGSRIYLAFYPDCAGAPQAIAFATAHATSTAQNFASSTLIPLNSPIAQTLRSGAENFRARVTGHAFFINRNGFVTTVSRMAGSANPVNTRQRYRGEMPNAPASVANPHYLAKFDSIEPIAH
ncbi:MAG: hypothetical protein WAM39_14045 [Bryobacteraceae bacterium]